ncbi:MAG: Fe-S-binding domain-containing protein [Chthonomonadales bacterium]|nr:Fe-S-binding domain-containing protein [Chthonomonadales bacterium]
MGPREILNGLRAAHGEGIQRADIPSDTRLYLFVDRGALPSICRTVFRDLDARYVISIGADDRPYSGSFMVAHDFAFDRDHVLCSILADVPAENPTVPSITPDVPAASWAEREIRDLVGIEPEGHRYLKRLVLPDGWPEGVHPLRKDFAWDTVPEDYDEDRPFRFDDPPEGCTVVPFGPFHPTLDEPAHFRLYVEGEMVRGCEYRGFMAHRGIEKLAESVLGYNDIPFMAERICGICGCVHSVAYCQAVESAVGIKPPPRAELIRTVMLEIERLHSHLLWVGLACHIVGFDTLFMQSFRIREPLMWIAERICGNRKTYGLCLVGGVRHDITPEIADELRGVLGTLTSEWRDVVKAVSRDRNIQSRTEGIGVADPALVKEMGIIGPVARAAGVAMDVRKDHPYAAYDRVHFRVITASGCDVWSRVLVRMEEVFESVGIIQQCLDHLEPGPLQSPLDDMLPVGRIGLSSVEAPRGESHHFLITGENNRPRRWRVRAPTYQNLQGVPSMIRDQRLADMTIALGSIDPCFSCTDRLETVEIATGKLQMWSPEEIATLASPAPGVSTQEVHCR